MKASKKKKKKKKRKKKKKKNEKKKKLESVLMKLKNDKNQTLLRKALYINFICLSVTTVCDIQNKFDHLESLKLGDSSHEDNLDILIRFDCYWGWGRNLFCLGS